MPFWVLRYKFTCSQAECGYHNALDAVAQADTPKTAASQVGKSRHLCGRCGRPLTDSSSLKMAVPVPISSVEKKRSVSESGKPPSQNRGSRLRGTAPRPGTLSLTSVGSWCRDFSSVCSVSLRRCVPAGGIPPEVYSCRSQTPPVSNRQHSKKWSCAANISCRAHESLHNAGGVWRC